MQVESAAKTIAIHDECSLMSLMPIVRYSNRSHPFFFVMTTNCKMVDNAASMWSVKLVVTLPGVAHKTCQI